MTIQFETDGEIHHADDCLPLRRAVEAGEMELHALGRRTYPGQALGRGEVPGVCSFGFWKTHGEQHHGLRPHRNEGVELTLSFQGETPVEVDGQTAVLHPGELMITRPWQPHAIGSPVFAPGMIGWLILDVGVRHPHQEWRWPSWLVLGKDDLATLTRSLRQNEDAVRAVPEELAASFDRLVRIARTPEIPHRASRVAVTINALLLALLDLFEANPVTLRPALTDASRSMRLFLDTLRRRPAEPWSVRGMADACGLGVTHFTRHFQIVTGEAPARYLLTLRLEAAASQLRADPSASVADIARRTGFSHANYFCRLFQARYGTTPARWRRETP